MKNIFMLFALLASVCLYGQGYECGTIHDDIINPKSGGCIQRSNDPNDYFRRYDYQKDLYSSRNSMVIPIDIYVWQKDDGTENYLDNQTNRDRLIQIIKYLDESFYNSISSPSFQPLPNVVDYDSTKIRFKLEHIFFEKNTVCWGKGGNTDEGVSGDGYFLNNKADSLHPENKRNFKIHITGYSTAPHSGFATFPTDDFSHQHYIVTLNKDREITISSNEMWGFAGHLAHEFGHNFDLRHTYCYKVNGEICDTFSECNENNPDYLDDVFGSTQNGSKMCPQESAWGCDVNDPNNSCTNNIMGNTKSARYFSPKQVQRMHRALSLLSIRNYAVAHNFDENEFIEVSTNQTWDFSTKLYNNLKVKSGVTLTIQCEVQFVPEAKVIIEPGAKLVIDGGKLTNEQYYNDFWRGIEVWGTSNKNQYPEANPTYQGLLVLKNGGTIENAHLGAVNWKPDNYNMIGGVIQSTDGVFRNNRRDVAFMSYQNYTPNYANKYRNLSRFTNTDFISDDDYIEKGLDIQKHVSMWKVLFNAVKKSEYYL